MSGAHYDLISSLVLVGLLSFPAYSVYWVTRQLRGGGWRRLWIAMVAFLAWCVATYFCFIRPMLGCLGGGCADKVSPFLELAVVYIFSSAMLIVLMHWCRAKNADEN